MSWLSKIKQYFVGEQDIEKEYEMKHQIEPLPEEMKAKPKGNLPLRKAQHSKMETKISYQYPAGNFRFPMIPDGKGKGNRQKPSSMQKGPEKPVPKSSFSKKTEPPKMHKAKQETHSERKPFQPTEIPSPIYGFRPRAEMESLPYQLREKNRNDRLEEEEILRKISSHSLRLAKEKAMLNQERLHGKKEYKKDDFFSEENSNLYVQQTKNQEQNEEKERNSSAFSLQFDKEAIETKIESQKEIKPEQAPVRTETRETDEERIEEFQSFEQETNKPDESKPFIQEASYETSEEVLETSHLTASEQPDYEAIDEIAAEEEEMKPVLKLAEEIIDEENKVQDLSVSSSGASGTEKLTTESSAVFSGEIEKEKNKVIEHQNGTEKRRFSQAAVPYNVLMLNRDQPKKGDRKQEGSYTFPSIQLLNVPPQAFVDDAAWLEEQKELLDTTLKNFNVGASVVNVTQGPAVTRFEVHPEPGVKVNKITNLSDDIKLSLSARDIRIEAPIPGKNTIGIEVPNLHSKIVSLREIARSPEFRNSTSPLTVSLGLDISGQPVVTDLNKMPHGLIAGATGSGKSVCINTMLVSLLYKASPHEVKLLLIDPKMVELAPYNNIPHLVSPVVTDVKAATGALKWAVEEMERRYEMFAHAGVRDIGRYNEMVKLHQQGEHIPYLVIVIDELADLMMVAPNDVEDAICRIAQKARACGIHLIVATQRPSVDVITGLIKANIPTRIAFSVSSQVDSRTIIDVSGAEKLLGRGDMLFLENGKSKSVRIQGNFVSDEEIERVVNHVKKQMKPQYLFHQEEFMKKSSLQSEGDELFYDACEFVVQQGNASTSGLQRRFRVGYNRAARLIDLMEEQGIISEARGSKPRDILISDEDLTELQESSVF
ncbi:DNA translocase FtsK [Metabacillus sp. RGM 3146]|uniref:DNA translocase FtsK n=1 Tax=Metabacillus sp. RGM 3146 TaxID=3401092 RepID=UPI003B999858